MKYSFIPCRSAGDELRLYKRYLEFSLELGYTPLLGNLESGESLVRLVDLLILPGGGDIGDSDFDSVANDLFDLKLYQLYHRHHKKILGICRGMQVINFLEGGSLKEVKNHENMDHLVLGDFQAKVNSYHHQAVGRIAKGVQVVLFGEDQTVEGLRVGTEVLGFQFHPELLEGEEREKVICYINGWLKA